MKDIKIIKKDETKLEIWTNQEISRELTLRFSARPEGYQFMPSYKMGHFDGWIRFYKSNCIPIGLLNEVKLFAKDKKYSLDIDFNDKLGLEKSDFVDFIKQLGLPEHFELRDYQINAAYDCINDTKRSVKANTAAGKSLIMYYIIRFMSIENKKTLIIVPTTSLVEQLYKDWKEYGWHSIDDYVTKIYSGKFKDYSKPVIIVTWQSMIKDLKVLKSFNTLMVDEAHTAKSKSLNKISSSCVNARWRLGFSGTYPSKNTVDWLSIVGNLGPIKQYTTYDSLKKAGQVSNLKITNLFLNWSEEVCKRNLTQNYKDYPNENKYIEELQPRIKFIIKLADRLQGNTIVLFTRIKYGKRLFEIMEKFTSKKCYYISGETKTDYRELIRSRMENNENVVLFASYGTFAQGINIKNLHNVIMSSNYKSLIKVVQAIGRAIRVLDEKESANIYNLIDDLSIEMKDGETYKNYSIQHHRERLKIYKSEGFKNIENVRIRLDKK